VFKVVLWNVNKPESELRQAAVSTAVAALVDNLDPDVIAFVEPPKPGSTVHGLLLKLHFHLWEAAGSRFAVFSKFSSRLAISFEPPSSPTRYEAWQLALPERKDLNLFLVHGRDRRNHNPPARESDMRQLAEDVRLMERLSGHDNTILLGDFNDRPFDPSLLRFDFLHSTNSRNAAVGVRELRGRKSAAFYNPSWSLLSDVHGGVPGTYYLKSPDEDEMHWNVIDQFMLRASLVPAFEPGGIRVITKAGGYEFLSALDRPLAEISDHLPVLLELDT
jgi:hypothetical protein